jgi:hypothetical protein
MWKPFQTARVMLVLYYKISESGWTKWIASRYGAESFSIVVVAYGMSHGSRVGPECDTDRPCRLVMTGCVCYCIVPRSRSAGCRLLKQYKIHFLPIVPDFRKSIIFVRLPGFDRWMMSAEHRWHDTDGGGPTYCNKNLPPPLLAPQMSLEWPEIELGPRRWEAWALTLSDSSECYYGSVPTAQ